MEINGKIVGSVLSVVLLVGVVIGLVAVVQEGQSNNNIGNRVGRRGGGGISTSNKALVDFCATSLDKETCASSILPIANLPNPSIKDFLSATLGSTMGQLNIAIEVTNKFQVNTNDDPYNDQMGVEDCREFLGYASEQLNAAIFSIGDGQIQTLQERVQDFIAWLTAVLVYQTTCVDQIDKPEYKQVIGDSLSNTTKLTSNAIYIFSQITNLAGAFDLTRPAAGVLGGIGNIAQTASSNLKDLAGGIGIGNNAYPLQTGVSGGIGFGINANQQQTGASRRLFDAEEGGGGEGGGGRRRGYPSWVTTRDRKLLQGGEPDGIIPNAVVAQDGSGQFITINDAINSVPETKKNAPIGDRFIIYVKAGDLSVGLKGVKTSNSATIGVDADWFMIKSVTIRNTAGPDGHQAVALRIAGQNAVVFDCSIEAYQDTLYYHRGKQFYKNCVISGTVDFMFGNGRAIVQDSLIVVRKPNPNQSNMVTADGGLTPMGEHGLVLQNCRITAENELMATKDQFKTYLGRPWKPYAITVYLQSDIGDFIAPEGYSIFTNVGEGSTNQQTAVYAEYQNTGPGANTDRRDRNNFQKWQLLNVQQAQGYTVGAFLDGGAWLSNTGVPYTIGL
ncbi:esterase [Lithospermum erythrorhizon]|uniref:Esterase n=1 Tax=Lithospermum erythrorhizon TaxID=34254 RepID=A0AAV3S325_LITER